MRYPLLCRNENGCLRCSMTDKTHSRIRQMAPERGIGPILLMCILAWTNFLPAQNRECGSKMDVPRILTAGVATVDHPQIRFYLLGIHKQGDLPRMTVSFNDNIYSSTDRGQTWRLVKRGASYFDYTASDADTKTLYRHHRNGQHGADLEISRDGGRSWSVIHPKTTKGRHLGSLWIVRTSARTPGRIFVRRERRWRERILYIRGFRKNVSTLGGWEICDRKQGGIRIRSFFLKQTAS